MPCWPRWRSIRIIHPLERLARAHRWLEEEDEARRRFREAAEQLETVLYRWAREDTDSISRIGSLLWRARDRGRRAPVVRACGTHPDAPRRHRGGRLPERCRRTSGRVRRAGGGRGGRRRTRGSRRSRRWRRRGATGAPMPAAEAVRRFTAVIGDDRVPPDEESGSSTLSLFDWLEESFRVRSALRGEPVPGPSRDARRGRPAAGAAPLRRSRRRRRTPARKGAGRGRSRTPSPAGAGRSSRP